MKHNFDTQLIHAGEEAAKAGRSVHVPIYRTSTFEMGEESVYQEILYGRMNNSPAHKALHEKLALIEGSEAALTFASGMSAISTAILGLVQPGDHMIVQKCIYGGTYALLADEAERLGIAVSFVDTEDEAAMQAALCENSRFLYVEVMSNPLLEVPDLERMVDFARQNGLKTMIDNTFASPANFRAGAFGFDVVLHSATKYLNGHTDVLAGAVMASRADIATLAHKLAHFGGCLDPQAVYLLNRGMKTLSVRLERQNSNALKVAEFLSTHAQVSAVHYPALEGGKFFDRARKYFVGGGGILSFEVESKAVAKTIIGKLEIPAHAPSIGGVDSLVVLPAESSHAGQSEEQLRAMGFSSALIRLSVGLEDPEDLIEDLKRALASV